MKWKIGALIVIRELNDSDDLNMSPRSLIDLHMTNTDMALKVVILTWICYFIFFMHIYL